MKLNTARFGTIEVAEEDVLRFTSGILGFEDYTKFALLSPENSSFSFLQSLEEPELAFVLIMPELVLQDYQVDLDKQNTKELQLDQASDGQVFSIVTVPENVQDMTANLQAPLVINTKRKLAKQVVLMNEKYHTKHNIFTERQQLRKTV